MSNIKKQIFTCLLALILILTLTVISFASVSGGSLVAVAKTGQVVDTIQFDGITVPAKYSLGGGYGSSEYSCAALVMRFYKMVYGFDVWNLSSSYATPTCSNGEHFTLTSTPRVGDIVRFQDRTHWALVKSVNGSTVTIIEQNWAYYSSQGYVTPINRTVEAGDSQVSFFTYSAYGQTKSVQSSTDVKVDYNTWEQALRVSNITGCEQLSLECLDNLKVVAANEQIESALTGIMNG